MLSVPPKFVFTPTIDNYAALVIGEQRGQYSSTRPDFPLFFLNSMIISIGRSRAVGRWPAFLPPTRSPASPSR